jgi:hypothetical protein
MRCGLLKLSRILRDGRCERRSFDRAASARPRSERSVRGRPAAERGAGGKAERESVEWTVSVDNFS